MSTDTIESINSLADFYANDLTGTSFNLKAEFDLYYMGLSQIEESLRPKNALDTLADLKILLEPLHNIRTLLYLLACLPITTCTNERSFSTLRRLKTYLRNTMSDQRLNGLALLSIHRELAPSTEEVVDTLSLGKRKIKLVL